MDKRLGLFQAMLLQGVPQNIPLVLFLVRELLKMVLPLGEMMTKMAITCLRLEKI